MLRCLERQNTLNTRDVEPRHPNTKKRRGRRKNRCDIEKVPTELLSDVKYFDQTDLNKLAMYTRRKVQRYAQQQLPQFLDDEMYDELCNR